MRGGAGTGRFAAHGRGARRRATRVAFRCDQRQGWRVDCVALLEGVLLRSGQGEDHGEDRARPRRYRTTRNGKGGRRRRRRRRRRRFASRRGSASQGDREGGEGGVSEEVHGRGGAGHEAKGGIGVVVRRVRVIVVCVVIGY